MALLAVIASVAGSGALLTSLAPGSSPPGGRAPEDTKAVESAARDAYGRMPISFEVNAGQTDADVDFLSRGGGYTLFLTPSEAVMTLQKGGSDEAADVLRMQLLGSNPAAAPASHDALPGKANYFVGDDKADWRTNVPTFAQATYSGVYPGIDLKYHGTQGRLEYDFLVAPGADPGAIRYRIAGADNLTLSPEGDLVVAAPGGELRHHKPVLFQEGPGGRRPVDGAFVLQGDEVSFQVGAYDSTATLVIDPTLGYSTYFGGPSNDFGFGIAVDASGRAYLGGQTNSAVFPRGGGGDFPQGGATPGAPQTTFAAGGSDAFILRVNAAGNALEYSTYLGGNRGDAGFDLAIDTQGNAYLVGATESGDDPGTTAVEKPYPTTDGTNGTVAAFDTSCGTDGTCNNVLPPNFFAPACDPFEPSCNPANPASPGYLAAICPPGSFPAGCATVNGQSDNFVSKVNAAGNQLLYSTFYGGSGPEQTSEEVPYSGQMGIAVWGTAAYVTSMTFSSDFPVVRAFQPTCGSCADGSNDAYLSVFQTTMPGPAGLLYSTFVGGTGFDEGKAVAVDSNGAAFLTGVITGVDSSQGGTTFPIDRPIGGTYVGSGFYDGSSYRGGYSDAYITKVNPFARSARASLVWSSFLGGGGKEEGWSVAVDERAGGPQVIVTGYTTSGPNPHPQIEDPAHPGACASGPGPWCDWASDPQPYFPITGAAHQQQYAGRASTDSGSSLYFDGDAFITKFTRDGQQLVYSTYLGGPNADYGQSVAVDVLGNAYVTGWTTCRNQNNGGLIAPPPQFDPDGIPTGRNPGEPAQSGVGDCPVGFPVVNAPPGLNVMNTFFLGNESHNSPTGVFVTKLRADGSGVDYSVLLDSRGFDRGFSIAVRSERRTGPDLMEAYVTGRTGSAPDFPLTAGSYDTSYNGGGRDAFITKLVG